MSEVELPIPSYILSFRSRRRSSVAPQTTTSDQGVLIPPPPAQEQMLSSTTGPALSSVGANYSLNDGSHAGPAVDPADLRNNQHRANLLATTTRENILGIIDLSHDFSVQTSSAAEAEVESEPTRNTQIMQTTSAAVHNPNNNNEFAQREQRDSYSLSNSTRTCSPSTSAETADPLQLSNNNNSDASNTDDIMNEDDEVLNCAICLDSVDPSRHAKATLACKHEFHLSCISMAFAMGKEMICPLCRYLHKDQPFMTLESDSDPKLNNNNRNNNSTQQQRNSQQSPIHHRLHHHHHHHHNHNFFSLNGQDTLISHEHPTSGTVLSMMPSFTDTVLGPPGMIQSAGICLKTSTWLLLYALPFLVAVAFLGFVLGQVETLWSKISCIIGSAICYMACWALVVAVMDPDHESRTILLNMEEHNRSEYDQSDERDTIAQGDETEHRWQQGAASRSAVEIVHSHNGANSNSHSHSQQRSTGHMSAIGEDQASQPTSSGHREHETQGFSTTRNTSLTSSGLSRRRPSRDETRHSSNRTTEAFQQNSNPTTSDYSSVERASTIPTRELYPMLQSMSSYSSSSISSVTSTSTTTTTTASPRLLSFFSWWTNNQYAQELQDRVMQLAEILDDFPDTIGEW